MSQNGESVQQQQQTNNGQEGGVEQKKGILICGRKVKHRKIALIMCYLGAGYQGMQRNPDVKTIEGDLEKALHLSGGIQKDERFNFGRLQWCRSARTDKGVSAVAQVVSIYMLVPKDQPEDMLQEINKHLPKQILIMDLIRTTPSFDAKKLCDYRVYEYLLPAWVLNPNTCKSAEDILEIITQTSKKINEQEKTEEILKQLFDDSQSQQTGNFQIHYHDFDYSQQQIDIPPQFCEGQLQSDEFTLDVELIQKFNQILRNYEGTHNFYNFTAKENPDSKHLKRYIKKFYVSGLINFKRNKNFNTELTNNIDDNNNNDNKQDECWICLQVCGQSFLLHQIRKMISVAIAVMRKEAPEDAIKTALSPTRDLNIPPAPAAPLYLNECSFGSYNNKWGNVKNEHCQRKILPMKDCAEKILQFKKYNLHPYIYSFCKSLKVFEEFCYNLKDSVYNFSQWKDMEEVRVNPQHSTKRKREQFTTNLGQENKTPKLDALKEVEK